MSNNIADELKALLNILKQCISSFQKDVNALHQSNGQEIISSLIFKLSKLSECAKTIQKLLKKMRKDEVKCFSCLKGSVTNQDSQHTDISQ